MDAKKVGGIIGPKGTTRKALEDVTGCVIEIPRDRNEMSMTIELTLSGTKQAVAMATKAINDFNTKGYIGILEGEDFSEGHMSVHPRNIPDLIGKGGTVRKALEAHTGVRINIPPNVPRTQTTMVKVDLAGSRSKIAELKKLVKELVKYGHTSITHPGMVHDEIEEEEVNATWYNLIIGKGGSEIRHIQNNFKVSVNIPNEQSPCENLLIVGLPQNVVAAKAYILKIIEKAITSRDKELQQAEADAAAERREESDDELEEEWMQQYIHPSKRKGTSAVNPAIDSAFPVLGSTAPPPTNDMSFPSAAGTDEAEGAASSAPQGAWAVTASGDPATPAPWAASTVAPFAT
jgi:rRNA processing protein Krr1/Pno1